jgi:hypothetical protein
MFAAQLGALHWVADEPCVQAPPPLQVPVLPQGGAAAHCPAGAGEPAGRLVQVPGLPATLQDWQVPQLGLPQQTPLTQAPLMHWVPSVHASPFAFRAQLRFGAVPWQVKGAKQSASAVQVVRHAFPAQT